MPPRSSPARKPAAKRARRSTGRPEGHKPGAAARAGNRTARKRAAPKSAPARLWPPGAASAPPYAAQPATERGEAARVRLLQAAHEQFLSHGFHGTSMRQIARAAGVAVGGIYNHFASKEEMFAAVLDAYHPYHVILPALKNAEGDTMESFLRAAAGRIQADIQGAEARLMPLVLIDLIEFQGQHLAELFGRVVPEILVFVNGLVERSADLRPVPGPVFMRALAGMMIGHLLTELIIRTSPLFKDSDLDWFGGTLDIFLHGVLKASPAEA
jgi:AcrR family transcriptional regulator